jgi:hypothetical protein
MTTLRALRDIVCPAHKAVPDAASILASAKKKQNGAKGLPAGGGWVYLINDSNDFLAWQFGIRSWSRSQRSRIEEIMSSRADYFSRLRTRYLMIVTPEKSVTYGEWLPDEFQALPFASERPALYMADQFRNLVSYPIDYLQTAKRHGFLYFRGDTHVNWLGAFHLYRYTIDAMRDRGIDLGPPIPLSHMQLKVACWDGDVLVQVPEILKAKFEADDSLWRPVYLEESVIEYCLHPDYRRAHRNAEPDVFRSGRPERETIVTEQPDSSLPRALIFRDSTATMMIDFLAEHFSRAVFVWHEDDVIGDFVEQERPDVVLHLKAERFLSSYPLTTPVSWISR